MRISKHVHSCLLLEHEGEKLLFDPGSFSFNEGRVKPETFGDVTTVVLTHNHPDHIDLPALKRILELSRAAVIGNGEVAEGLRPEGIEVEVLEEGTRQAGAFTLQAMPVPHEPILAPKLPRHTAILVNDRVLNPGDSFAPALDAFKGVELLVLPIMAPFLTETAAAAFARRMAPRQVLPVHDGYARDFFLKARHAVYGSHLAEHGIRFHPLAEPGAAIEL